jgi:hypothetical protein
MRRSRLAVPAGIVLAALLSACVVAVRPPPPPPPLAEAVPPPPNGTVVWVPAHWVWNGSQYVLVRGHYEAR